MKHVLEASLILATITVGCASTSKVDIGAGHEPASGVLGESLTDYAGVWDGYAEAFSWNDGTDHVRITLDESGNGTIEVGEVEPFPAPDPAHGYPPGDDDPNTKLALAGTPALVSGFAYPVEGAMVKSSRIRFGAVTRSLYQEWCEAQPSYLDTGAWPTRYGCTTGLSWSEPEGGPPVCLASNGGDFSDPDMAQVVDCGQAATCIAFCECTETSCGINPTEDTLVDAALDDEGETLEGTLVLGTLRIVIRMARM